MRVNAARLTPEPPDPLARPIRVVRISVCTILRPRRCVPASEAQAGRAGPTRIAVVAGAAIGVPILKRPLIATRPTLVLLRRVLDLIARSALLAATRFVLDGAIPPNRAVWRIQGRAQRRWHVELSARVTRSAPMAPAWLPLISAFPGRVL